MTGNYGPAAAGSAGPVTVPLVRIVYRKDVKFSLDILESIIQCDCFIKEY